MRAGEVETDPSNAPLACFRPLEAPARRCSPLVLRSDVKRGRPQNAIGVEDVVGQAVVPAASDSAPTPLLGVPDVVPPHRG